MKKDFRVVVGGNFIMVWDARKPLSKAPALRREFGLIAEIALNQDRNVNDREALEIAQTMAASFDLLDACIDAEKWFIEMGFEEDHDGEIPPEIVKMRKAIKKAKTGVKP